MSQAIEKLLLAKYPPPAHAFLPQCRNGTGYTRITRTADAIVMSLYPSRGLHLTGFEFKEHRGDWLNEMRNPDKAEAIAQFCHYWYLVISSDHVCKLDELPKTWGLLVIENGKLKQKAEPTFNQSAKAPDYPFLGAILRNAMGRTPLNIEIEAARKEGLEEGVKAGTAQGQSSLSWMPKRLEELEKQIKEFEEASGLEIKYGWEHAKIGAAVRRILSGEDTEAELAKMADRAEIIAKTIRQIRSKK